jgi:hypothetical protein
MTERKLNFVKAGDNDASEVIISTGLHIANVASELERISYTISYPGGGDGIVLDGAALKEKFESAADAIINDASVRKVAIGQT